MPNPKKHHVRYVRRIPASFVDKMDTHLRSLNSPIELPDALKAVLGEPVAKKASTQGDGVSGLLTPTAMAPYQDRSLAAARANAKNFFTKSK